MNILCNLYQLRSFSNWYFMFHRLISVAHSINKQCLEDTTFWRWKMTMLQSSWLVELILVQRTWTSKWNTTPTSAKMMVSSAHAIFSNYVFSMYKCVVKFTCVNNNWIGGYIINVRKTWEKLLLAARAIVAIENPADVCAISSRQYGQRAVLKFAAHTGSNSIAGRYTPGTFTNQIQVCRICKRI